MRNWLILSVVLFSFSCIKVQAETPGKCTTDIFVEVEHTQGGIAGQRGDRISIGSDGCFVVEQIVNGQVISQVQSGQLDAKQMSAVRAAVETANLKSLTKQSEQTSLANPSIISVTREGVTNRVIAPWGTNFEEQLATLSKDNPDARLIQLAVDLVELTGGTLSQDEK